MPLDNKAALDRLRKFDLAGLFTQELGWDWFTNKATVKLKDETFSLHGVAEKRGVQVFHCQPNSDGKIPPAPIRAALEKEVTKRAREHLLIFTDKAESEQLWLYTRREPGRPIRQIPYRFHPGRSNELLLQKLSAITFSLSDEEGLTLLGVTTRLKDSLDRDTVTKKFYNEFKKQREAFMKFLKGIPDKDLQEWYAAVLLNRLMFIYFIQQKGFLGDGDQRYLQNHLHDCKGNYYQDFLCPLFFKGFALRDKQRSAADRQLLGQVPYLNGGLFLEHEIERLHGETIEIANKGFNDIFAFFDQWHWHLDDNPIKDGREINPDILGYIYEKYINQKQMGAYYTKEDITEYIAKNTIIPFLFDAARAKCKVAFEAGDPSRQEGPTPTAWDILREDPDRYIYEPVRRGVIQSSTGVSPVKPSILPETELPNFVQKGMHDPKARMFDKRYNLGRAEIPGPDEANLALPTETWREYVERRKRCLELREKLASGAVRDINELITLNLDIRQFAEDVIARCEGPELLRAFWHAIEKVTVLDPTCGSGAFLFAALNILEPLYEACLGRMEAFLTDEAAKHKPESLKFTSQGIVLLPHDKFKDISATLDHMSGHASSKYFIYKTIVLNNLYGVDIMEEATEICKLRLFLKLVSQIDNVEDIEPLPDIDFNIRAGNTLVGFATLDEVKRSLSDDIASLPELPRIQEEAENADRAFQLFRSMQTEEGMDAKEFSDAKRSLRKRIEKLRNALNRFLASEYSIYSAKAMEKWLRSHQPFHWFVEFYGILNSGGFDVIIGNPPYLEIREVSYSLKNYKCLESGAIHAMCMERSERLLKNDGCMSMIVPLSLPSTQRMQVVQDLLERGRSAWYANYAWRPAKLFDTVNRALTIFLVNSSLDAHTFATNYQKWTSESREGLMERINYVEVPRKRTACWVPKLGHELEESILKKCMSIKTSVKYFISKSDYSVYYRTDGGLYWKVFTDFAPAFVLNGKKGHSSRETWFTVAKKPYVRSVIATLSSDVFWWWYTVTSNVRHLNPFDIHNFPVSETILADSNLQVLGTRYLKDLDKNSTMLTRQQKQTGTTKTQSFKIQKSKSIIDEIDAVLAQHYGFTDEELDFIINYDIKYRMGLDGVEDDQT